MRVKDRVLNGGSCLFEDRVGICGEFLIHALTLKLGKFPTVMDGSKGFPQENGDQSYANDGSNEAKDQTQYICWFGTVKLDFLVASRLGKQMKDHILWKLSFCSKVTVTKGVTAQSIQKGAVFPTMKVTFSGRK